MVRRLNRVQIIDNLGRAPETRWRTSGWRSAATGAAPRGTRRTRPSDSARSPSTPGATSRRGSATSSCPRAGGVRRGAAPVPQVDRQGRAGARLGGATSASARGRMRSISGRRRSGPRPAPAPAAACLSLPRSVTGPPSFRTEPPVRIPNAARPFRCSVVRLASYVEMPSGRGGAASNHRHGDLQPRPALLPRPRVSRAVPPSPGRRHPSCGRRAR